MGQNQTRLQQVRTTTNRIMRVIVRLFRAILIYAVIGIIMGYIAQKYYPELTTTVAPHIYAFCKACLTIVEWVYGIAVDCLRGLGIC